MLDLFQELVFASVVGTLRTRPMTVLDGFAERVSRKARPMPRDAPVMR